MAHEIRHLTGRPGRFAVFDGVIQRSGILSKDGAEEYLERVRRKARETRRSCLCCSVTFRSEGPHNRLCDRCRSKREFW